MYRACIDLSHKEEITRRRRYPRQRKQKKKNKFVSS